MHKFLIIIYLTLHSICSVGQINTFQHVYGGTQNDEAKAIIETYENGFAIIGATSSVSNGNSDILLLKLDSASNLLWSKVYGGSGIDWGYDIKETIDSGLVIIGYSNSYSSNYDVLLIKTDRNGNLEWQKTYGGTDWDFGYAIDTTENNGFIVCGKTYSYGNGNSDMFILKLNNQGDTIWTKTYGSNNEDIANDIIKDFKNNIVTVGYTTQNEIQNFHILKLNSTNGDTLWTLEFGNEYSNQLNKILNSNDSSSYTIFGTKYFSNDSAKMYIAKIDTSGILIWENLHGDSKLNKGNSIFQTKGGPYFLVGEQNGKTKQAVSFLCSPNGNWWGKDKIDKENDEYYVDVIQPRKKGSAMIGNSNSFGLGYYDIIFKKGYENFIVDSNYFNYTILNETNVVINNIDYNFENTSHTIIYPNPHKNQVTINSNEEIINQIEFIDLLGKTIYTEKNINQNQQTINTESFAIGFYFIKIDFENHSETYKIEKIN